MTEKKKNILESNWQIIADVKRDTLKNARTGNLNSIENYGIIAALENCALYLDDICIKLEELKKK